MHAGWWEEARVPGENPHMLRENMQLMKKDPSWDSNQELSCCELTMLDVQP